MIFTTLKKFDNFNDWVHVPLTDSYNKLTETFMVQISVLPSQQKEETPT